MFLILFDSTFNSASISRGFRISRIRKGQVTCSGQTCAEGCQGQMSASICFPRCLPDGLDIAVSELLYPTYTVGNARCQCARSIESWRDTCLWQAGKCARKSKHGSGIGQKKKEEANSADILWLCFFCSILECLAAGMFGCCSNHVLFRKYEATFSTPFELNAIQMDASIHAHMSLETENQRFIR